MAISKDIISCLPLFMGLSDKELSEIAGEVSFALHHHKKGSIIAESGKPCNGLITIINGQVTCETVADDHSYRLLESIHTMHVVEPNKLFGLQLRYASTYHALTSCETIEISKEGLLELLSTNFIVRLNYLNMLCRSSQTTEHNPWKACPPNLEGRIVQFVKNRVKHPAGSKTIYITMKRLANELCTSRLEVSIALNNLANQERIILKRGIIEIPALQLL
jgi:CRP-like cAMP-binding protein